MRVPPYRAAVRSCLCPCRLQIMASQIMQPPDCAPSELCRPSRTLRVYCLQMVPPPPLLISTSCLQIVPRTDCAA